MKNPQNRNKPGTTKYNLKFCPLHLKPLTETIAVEPTTNSFQYFKEGKHLGKWYVFG